MILGIKLKPKMFEDIKADAQRNGLSVPCWIADAVCLHFKTEPNKIGHRYHETTYPDIRFHVSKITSRLIIGEATIRKLKKVDIIREAIVKCL